MPLINDTSTPFCRSHMPTGPRDSAVCVTPDSGRLVQDLMQCIIAILWRPIERDTSRPRLACCCNIRRVRQLIARQHPNIQKQERCRDRADIGLQLHVASARAFRAVDKGSIRVASIRRAPASSIRSILVGACMAIGIERNRIPRSDRLL